MTGVPWNKGLQAYDRGWADGYNSGVHETLWGRVRDWSPLLVGVVLWRWATQRRVHPVIRLVCLELLVVGIMATVALSPVWVTALVVSLRRHRQGLRRMAEVDDLEPFAD